MQYPQVYVPGHRQTSISSQPACLTDAEYDYMLEEIARGEKIEFEIEVVVYSDDMEY